MILNRDIISGEPFTLYMGKEALNISILMVASFLFALLWLLVEGHIINGDEAVIGLMAIKIRQGVDFPLFFWKAHYSGPLASYLLAPLHSFWPPSGLLLHSIMVPFHMFYVVGIYLYARQWLDNKTSFIAGFFAAVPLKLFPYSPLGGYTESLIFVPWIFLLVAIIHKESGIEGVWKYFACGLLMGFSLWIFPIIIPAILASFYLLYRSGGTKRKIMFLFGGGIIGFLPVILHNIRYPGATLLRLGSRPAEIGRDEFSSLINSRGYLSSAIHIFENWIDSSFETILLLPEFIIKLFGINYWTDNITVIAGAIGVLMLCMGIVFCLDRNDRNGLIAHLLPATVLTNLLFVVMFALNRTRYLIPILIVLPLISAVSISKIVGIKNKWIMVSATLLIVLSNGYANFKSWEHDDVDYEKLAIFLEKNGLNQGYADYFTAYSLNYLSDERLVFSPALHQPGSDRYFKYTEIVSAIGTPVFIFREEELLNVFKKKARNSGFKFLLIEHDQFTIVKTLSRIPKLTSLRLSAVKE